jgi:hypothetical protein
VCDLTRFGVAASTVRVTGHRDVSATIRHGRQGIGAAALACVGAARRLTGKTLGTCAGVLRRAHVMIVVFLLGLGGWFSSERVADDKGRATLVIVGSTRSTSPDGHGAQDQSSGGEQQNELTHGTPPHVHPDARLIRIDGPVTELTAWDGPLRQQLCPFPVFARRS